MVCYNCAKSLTKVRQFTVLVYSCGGYWCFLYMSVCGPRVCFVALEVVSCNWRRCVEIYKCNFFHLIETQIISDFCKDIMFLSTVNRHLKEVYTVRNRGYLQQSTLNLSSLLWSVFHVPCYANGSESQQHERIFISVNVGVWCKSEWNENKEKRVQTSVFEKVIQNRRNEWPIRNSTC